MSCKVFILLPVRIDLSLCLKTTLLSLYFELIFKVCSWCSLIFAVYFSCQVTVHISKYIIKPEYNIALSICMQSTLYISIFPSGRLAGFTTAKAVRRIIDFLFSDHFSHPLTQEKEVSYQLNHFHLPPSHPFASPVYSQKGEFKSVEPFNFSVSKGFRCLNHHFPSFPSSAFAHTFPKFPFESVKIRVKTFQVLSSLNSPSYLLAVIPVSGFHWLPGNCSKWVHIIHLNKWICNTKCGNSHYTV